MKGLKLIYFFGLAFCALPAFAEDISLDSAISNARGVCSGISSKLADIKKMAGINTAITGVGTVAGAGGVVAGGLKASKDKESASLEAKLKALDARDDNGNVANFEYLSYGSKFESELEDYIKGIITDNFDANAEKSNLQSKISESDRKSKNLGNIRTGLLATNTATNIAGTVIAGINRVNGDLKSRIQECIDSVKILDNARMRTLVEQELSDDDPQIQKAKKISDACGNYDLSQLSKINSKATGAMVAGSIGIATGGAGTITSAMANSNSTRSDNSTEGQKKENKLNVTSNVLAVGATGASLVGTIFNATQISAAKKIIKVADECEEVLK